MPQRRAEMNFPNVVSKIQQFTFQRLTSPQKNHVNHLRTKKLRCPKILVMLNLELHWKAHPTTKETIIGICPELPDSFCYFYIMRMADEKFWAEIKSTLYAV
jgi:hypothetical protein